MPGWDKERHTARCDPSASRSDAPAAAIYPPELVKKHLIGLVSAKAAKLFSFKKKKKTILIHRGCRYPACSNSI